MSMRRVEEQMGRYKKGSMMSKIMAVMAEWRWMAWLSGIS